MFGDCCYPNTLLAKMMQNKTPTQKERHNQRNFFRWLCLLLSCKSNPYLRFLWLYCEYYSSEQPTPSDFLLSVVPFPLCLLFQRILLPTEERGLVPDLWCLQCGNEVCRKWADYNIKLCGGALSNLTCVVPTLQYNQFILPPIKLN